MCTAAEPASHGQDAGAGCGSQNTIARLTSAAPTEIATVSSCLSFELLSSAFHPACSAAAPSTASVIGSEMSCTLEDHLLDERRHALDRGAAFLDRLLRAVEVHGAEPGQQRREQHIRRVAGQAAARHAHLDDVERGGEDF